MSEINIAVRALEMASEHVKQKFFLSTEKYRNPQTGQLSEGDYVFPTTEAILEEAGKLVTWIKANQ